MVCKCGKHCHSSKSAALRSQKYNGNRMRAYWSVRCRCWYVTKSEKL